MNAVIVASEIARLGRKIELAKTCIAKMDAEPASKTYFANTYAMHQRDLAEYTAKLEALTVAA